MKLVDLTQPWGDRMPTWPQFASIEVTDITTHHRDRKSTMLVKTNMHTGTHIDAPSHYCETGKHLGQIPIEDLVGTGLVIDLRPVTDRWSFYTLDQVLGCLPPGEEIRPGDIVVFYTGWEKYNWTQETRDDVMYFDRHPGPRPEVIDYLVEEYEQMSGRPIEETLPMKWFEYAHYTTARNNISMLENLGGEIAQVAGRRVTLGAFPWRWIGGEGCICRVVAFLDV